MKAFQLSPNDYLLITIEAIVCSIHSDFYSLMKYVLFFVFIIQLFCRFGILRANDVIM